MPYIHAGGFIGFGSYPLAGSPLCFAFPSLFFSVRSCAAGVIAASNPKVAVILAELQVRACG